MSEWTIQSTANWIINRCLKDKVGHPSGVGILIQPDTLNPGDPDWSLICAAMELLRTGGDPWITAKPGSSFSSKGKVARWQNVKLTSSGFVRILTAQEQRAPIGFEFKE